MVEGLAGLLFAQAQRGAAEGTLRSSLCRSVIREQGSNGGFRADSASCESAIRLCGKHRCRHARCRRLRQHTGPPCCAAAPSPILSCLSPPLRSSEAWDANSSLAARIHPPASNSSRSAPRRSRTAVSVQWRQRLGAITQCQPARPACPAFLANSAPTSSDDTMLFPLSEARDLTPGAGWSAGGSGMWGVGGDSAELGWQRRPQPGSSRVPTPSCTIRESYFTGRIDV